MIDRIILILIYVLLTSQTGQQFEERYTKVAYIDGIYANVSPADSRFLNWDTTAKITFYFNINSNNDLSVKDATGKFEQYYNADHKYIPQYNDTQKDTSVVTFRETGGNFFKLTYYGNGIKLFNPKAKHAVTIYSR